MIARSPIALLTSLWLFSPLAAAQSHLEPERGVYNQPEWRWPYEKRLREVLLKDAALHHVARMICLPSFRPEWMVSVVRVDGKHFDDPPTYYVEFVGADRKLFPPEKSEGAKAGKLRAPVDRETVMTLDRTWRRMLRTTRYPEEMGGGADGVDYHFSRLVPLSDPEPDEPPGGWEQGTIWSPDEVSPCGRLVAVGELLRSYAEARPEDREKFRSRIRAALKTLEGQLDRAGNKP